MDIIKEKEKREIFKDLLENLSKDPAIFSFEKNQRDYFHKLETLYILVDENKTDKENQHDYFRHYYSDIFSTLVQIKNSSSSQDLEILGQNINWLVENYQDYRTKTNCTSKDISDPLKKLLDHVNLDIARLNYIDTLIQEKSGLTELREQVSKVNEAMYDNMEESKTKINKIESDLNAKAENLKNEFNKSIDSKLDNVNKEYVSILGIFAGIVLAFIGGAVFSSSVLNNISQSSIYRIVLVSLIIGFIFLNTIGELLHWIAHLLNKPIKVKLLKTVNWIIIGAITIDCLCWGFGIVEKRNSMLHPDNSANTVIVRML